MVNKVHTNQTDESEDVTIRLTWFQHFPCATNAQDVCCSYLGITSGCA
uniref:Uncharacterized protein n=1 Tax=Arundo donax TaxID=35708 RepID=A0A0A8YFB3_ARUDO